MIATPQRRRYLLDAGVVIALQRTGHLDALASLGVRCDMTLVEEVYDELVRPACGKHSLAASAARAVLDAQVSVVSIDVGTEAANRLLALRARRTSVKADLGESASIAWAAEHEDYVFVTRDAAASYVALEELRGRVRSFYYFLREAVEFAAFDRVTAKAIADAAQVTPGVLATPPLWWTDWVSAG